MAESPSIRFLNTPNGSETNSENSIDLQINTGIEDETENLRGEVAVRLYVDGERVGGKESDDHLQDEDLTRTINHTFDESGTYRLRAFVGVDWYLLNGTAWVRQGGEYYDQENETSTTISISPTTFTAGDGIGSGDFDPPGEGDATGYVDAFDNRTPVTLRSIVPDEDIGVTVPNGIAFTPHDNPNISVDTSGRFAKHEIIGGTTVRQKIGEDPVNITVSGVCDEGTAQQIDQLRNARQANLISDRISMTVQIGSTSTDPFEDGGAASMKTGDMLYNYNMSLIGVEEI